MRSRRLSRPYSEAELRLYEQYRECRARAAPSRCDLSAECWVMLGPPAMTGHHECKGCGGLPRAMLSLDVPEPFRVRFAQLD